MGNCAQGPAQGDLPRTREALCKGTGVPGPVCAGPLKRICGPGQGDLRKKTPMQWNLRAQTLSGGLVQKAVGKGPYAAELVHKDLCTGTCAEGPVNNDLCVGTMDGDHVVCKKPLKRDLCTETC